MMNAFALILVRLERTKVCAGAISLAQFLFQFIEALTASYSGNIKSGNIGILSVQASRSHAISSKYIISMQPSMILPL